MRSTTLRDPIAECIPAISPSTVTPAALKHLDCGADAVIGGIEMHQRQRCLNAVHIDGLKSAAGTRPHGVIGNGLQFRNQTSARFRADRFTLEGRVGVERDARLVGPPGS